MQSKVKLNKHLLEHRDWVTEISSMAMSPCNPFPRIPSMTNYSKKKILFIVFTTDDTYFYFYQQIMKMLIWINLIILSFPFNINWNLYRDKNFSVCNFKINTIIKQPWMLTLDSVLKLFQSSIGQFAGLTTAKAVSVRHLP